MWAVGMSREMDGIPSAEGVKKLEGSTEIRVSGGEAGVGLGEV